MKVVINACHGGFSLSSKAECLYAKMAGFDIFRYIETRYRHDGGGSEYQRVSPDCDGHFFSLVYKKDHGEALDALPDRDEGGYWYSRNLPRNDEILVKVVEILGDDASGDHAKLKIVEIPDGVDFEIDEYDGFEHVAEKHRTWS